jgi:hypothetical protein
MPDESRGGCKVDRISRKYDLDDIDEVLRDDWEEGTSLRDLETQYNQRVLEAALRAAGVEVLQGEVENLYQLVTGDDVSAGTQVEARSRLEQYGIDPESVRDDFVSYQTIRTHLRECLAMETERESSVTPTDAKNTVFKLLSRTESITRRTIDRLRSSGQLDVGEVDVTLSLRIACTDCGQEYTFSRLLERGRCSCTGES